MLVFYLCASVCCALDTVDPDFAPVVRGPGSVRTMAWHPGGWIYASVYADKLNGQLLSSPLVRFDEDGVWDSDYQLAIDDLVTHLLVLESGKVIIGGTFTEVDGHETYHVARLNADGSVDIGFTVMEEDIPTGTSYSGSYLNAMEAGPGGSLFLGFSGAVDYDYDEYGQRFYIWPDILVKLDNDGSRDAGFAPELQFDLSDGGFVYPNEILSIRALLWTADDHLLVGGDFELVNGTAQRALAKLDLNGDLVEAFQPEIGEPRTQPIFPHTYQESVRCLAEAADGSYYIGSNFKEINGVPQLAVARLGVDGTLDLAFRVDFDTGYSSSHSVGQILVEPSGSLLLLGEFSMDGSYQSSNCVRVDGLYGRQDTDFGLSFRSPDGVLLLPDGDLIAYRYSILTSNGVVQAPIARLMSDGEVDTSAILPTLRKIRDLDLVEVLPGGRLLVQGSLLVEANDVEVSGIAVLTELGAIDTEFLETLAIDKQITASAVLPGGRILVGGYFTSISGFARESVAMLEPDGTLVEAFDLNFGSYTSVSNIYVLPSGRVFLEGRFYDATNTSLGESGIIDFKQSSSGADLSFDAIWSGSFNPGLDDFFFLDDVAEQPDGKLVLVGSFLIDDSFVDAVRLNVDGSTDGSFDPEAQFSSFYPSLVEAGADGSLYLGGSSFRLNDESSSRYLVKLLPDGSVDTAFTGPTSSVYDLKLDVDGSLWCSGYFSNPAKRIAHLNADGTLIESFDPGDSANPSVRILALEAPDRLYIAGSFTEVQGEPRAGLARINLETPIKPQVRLVPVTKTVGEGTALTLSLSGMGRDETYVWYHNGEPLSGESGSSLTLPGVSLADVGAYSVEATNSAGTTETDATLAVTEYSLADWLAAYGLSDGDADADGDGRRNADEYLARTNPNEARSYLDTRTARSGGGLRLNWATSPARSYQVEVCNDMVSWEPYGEPVTGSGAESALDLTSEQLGQWRFWRVSVSKP